MYMYICVHMYVYSAVKVSTMAPMEDAIYGSELWPGVRARLGARPGGREELGGLRSLPEAAGAARGRSLGPFLEVSTNQGP